MIPKSAGRTPIACSNCAKTKTKCDKKFPCSRCAGRNLKCTLRPTRRSTKNAQRVGVPPEGAVAVPPYTEQLGPQDGAVEVLCPSGSPRQQPHPLKPSSPQTMGTIVPENKQTPPVVDGPPVDFVQRPTSGPTPPAQLQMSPSMQATGGFVPYEDFAQTTDSSESGSSPRFMLDWSQMQVPIGYEGVVQPTMLINQEMMFDSQGIPIGPPGDAMLPMMTEIVPSLITPLETPKGPRSLSDMDMGHPGNPIRLSRHISSGSIHSSSQDFHGDALPIVAAQDAWNVFRCTPTIPSTSCPKTARLNLEMLEQTLRNHQGWSTWSPHWDESDFAGAEHLTVMQLHESTRDKLLAITQSFLHKALEIHREGGSLPSPASSHHSPGAHGGSNFVLLPPARVLEYFLRSYANCSERYYPLTSRGILDANELMHCYNDRAASLLVLMMIAQGAMNIPSREARMLTGGLTEACRISLFDLIERNVIMSGDPIVLHSALLFTVQAAWSGDKWQMDISMGQRGMYFAMLRHSGVLENRSVAPTRLEQHNNTDQLWTEWIQNESRSRLVYSWVMVDQDMSLFHDTAPLFSVTELAAPLPDADRLWEAKSAAEWSSIFEQVHEFSGGYPSVGSGARPLSLRDLFRHFLDDEMIPLGIEMTPLQLRLLLHPLQSLVCQYHQLLSCFSDSRSSRDQNSRVMTAASTRTRLEEVQSLLRKWFDLAERYLKANLMCPMMQTSLVIFHIISLNAVTNFSEIERLARRENVDGTYQQLVWLHKRCIFDVEEAVFHCGQVFRLIRSMPQGIRPPWWAGAIYRVGLILWTDSLIQRENMTPSNGLFPVPGPSFAIDALPADHPLIVRYLTKREGVPCVTKRDGSQMAIDQAYPMLLHCIETIDEGISTRFSDGIRSKLNRLAQG